MFVGASSKSSFSKGIKVVEVVAPGRGWGVLLPLLGVNPTAFCSKL